MKERFVLQAELKTIRAMGLKCADTIADKMKACGYNSTLEPFLWEAFNIGYEAGKVHSKRLKKFRVPTRTEK